MALVSGPTLADAIADPANELTKLVATQSDDAKLIDELFVRILNRPADCRGDRDLPQGHAGRRRGPPPAGRGARPARDRVRHQAARSSSASAWPRSPRRRPRWPPTRKSWRPGWPSRSGRRPRRPPSSRPTSRLTRPRRSPRRWPTGRRRRPRRSSIAGWCSSPRPPAPPTARS